MIGILETINPKTGQRITIRYTRVDKKVRITSISDSAGMDIWDTFSADEFQDLKKSILGMSC